MSPAHVQRCASGQVAAGTHTLCNEPHEREYAGGLWGEDKFFSLSARALVPRPSSSAKRGDSRVVGRGSSVKSAEGSILRLRKSFSGTRPASLE